MAIRTRKYIHTAGGTREVRAIRITEKNYIEISNYINRNGGVAVASEYVSPDGDRYSHKIRIRQLNHLKNRTKRDWRVARPGDFIVRHDNGEFERVKEDVFEQHFELAK